jgi:hypothetical protein
MLVVAVVVLEFQMVARLQQEELAVVVLAEQVAAADQAVEPMAELTLVAVEAVADTLTLVPSMVVAAMVVQAL